MIWIVLACIFGVFIGKVIRDAGVAQLQEVLLVDLQHGFWLLYLLEPQSAVYLKQQIQSDPVESHDIVALQDNIYATCFRNADGYLKITYLYKNVDETGEENYKNETIEGSSAQIYLKDDVIPHVDAYKPIFINKTVNFIFGSPIFYSDKYNIYVPEDTIKMDYNVDLKQ